MRSFQQLGLDAISRHDYPQAEAHFRQAIDHDQSDWLNYVLLSAILDCCGYPVKASSVLVDFCCTLDLLGGYEQAAARLDARLQALDGGERPQLATLTAWLTLYRAMVDRFCGLRPLTGGAALAGMAPSCPK